MYRVIPLVIVVILPLSISATSKWPRSRMSFLASSVDFENHRKTVLRPDIPLRVLAKSPSILRSDLEYPSQAKGKPGVQRPEIKHTTICPHVGNEYNLSRRSTCQNALGMMERYIASLLGVVDEPADRFDRVMERLLVKVLLLVCVHILLGGNVAIELRCLIVVVILFFDVSEVLAGPIISFSPTPQTSARVTPSIVDSHLPNATKTTRIHASGTALSVAQSSVHFHQSVMRFRSVGSNSTVIVDSSSTQQPSTGSNSTVIVNSSSTQQPSTRPNTPKNELTRPTTRSEPGPQFQQGACESDWLQFNENKHCYRFFKFARTFDHAQKVCFYEGAHLVTTSNKTENDFVFGIVRKFTSSSQDQRSIWLGLERMSSDSRLHTVDGSPLDYKKWAPGEPDSNGACVKMIRKAWWEDTSCMEQLYFICERDAPRSPPYSRSVELAVLIGIPMACALVMLSVVTVLFMRSVRDSEGTHFGYGKKRDRSKLHSCLAQHIATNGHIGPQEATSELELQESSNSRNQSPLGSRRCSTPPEIRIIPETPELPVRQEAQVFASTLSIDQEPSRVQSATSLDQLVSKSYFKPKSRRMRSLRKSEAVVSPAGKAGRFRKKDQE